MTQSRADVSNAPRPLRLWPGVVLLMLQWLVRFGIPVVFPEQVALAVLGGLGFGIAIGLWWMFFSRALWSERLGTLGLTLLAIGVAFPLADVSIKTGMMGMMFFIYATPTLTLAFVAWAILGRNLKGRMRWLAMAVVLLVGAGIWTLFRTNGMAGNAKADLAWRWAPTAEEQLLAEGTGKVKTAAPLVDASVAEVDWPGFRGPNRDGVVVGVRIDPDWTASPPKEMWRQAVGPAWSSFAVRGNRFFTQEQRGEEEVVSCYQVGTGKMIWRHGDSTRFWESNAGAGPRATPSLFEDRVYAFGGTGILNVLEAEDGRLVWSRNVGEDTGVEISTWGFSSSPLIYGDLVVVAAAGTMAAYDLGTGESRWKGPDGGASYSSPQLVVIGGQHQILMMVESGVTAVSPDDGKTLWHHDWEGYPILQPAMTGEGELLIAVNARSGLRKLAISNDGGNWKAETLWSTNRMKPYFNDVVVHRGYVYGFDGRILACIDAAKGERQWKGGRYGNGQLFLLADQNLLVVVSEEGELVLVSAAPDAFHEVARVPAIEGKTWNHPVLAGDVLLVRNSEVMAAFKLALQPAEATRL